MFHTCERCGLQTPDYLPVCDCKPVKRSMALSPQRKPKKTVIVLPHDERIQTVNGRVVFRYPNGNGGHVSIDCDAPHFPLICLGLWEIEVMNQILNGYPKYHTAKGFKMPWLHLAKGFMKLEECRFRKMTAKERKEIGV